MKKIIFISLVAIMLIMVMSASTVLGISFTAGTDPVERPSQSETEFVVALDPEFADQVLLGQSEIFGLEDEETSQPKDPKGNKKHKTISSGLLKKGSDGKKVHIKGLEHYKSRQIGNTPALVTVEVEDKNKMDEARAAVEMCEGVLYTDPLAYYYADDFEFNDPRAAEQWGLIPIDAYDAWNDNPGLSDITIAILDTGVRLTHEDLAASIVPGWDFVGNDPDPSDEYGHGTHVAGIAAALCDNRVGIASPAGGAKIMPVRVLNANGSGTVLDISEGIYYAADHGADIINMSLGGKGDTVTMRNAVNYALDKGCLIVAAAGNDGSGSVVSYPARYDGVIIAASFAPSVNRNYPYGASMFSNYDADCAYRIIHAPGEKILSTYYNYDSAYAYMSGTSMAAPYISGMAAALLARGEYEGSLSDALIAATVTMPRAILNAAKDISKVSGEMKVLNYSANLDLPTYSGYLVLTLNSNPTRSRTVQARVTARDNAGLIDTTFNGTVNVSFVRSPEFAIPKFGTPQYTTYFNQLELVNGNGTIELNLTGHTGYNYNAVINFWASDPLRRLAKSADVSMTFNKEDDLFGCSVEITIDKPDNYTGSSSLPTGQESYLLPIYYSYYETIDSNEPPSGLSAAGATSGRFKWDPVKLQYRGTLNLPRGKVQLYYYVYYYGSDSRYPNPQPIGSPLILNGNTSVSGKLMPYVYRVSFNANGGEPVPATQSLPSGGLATPPGTINREGYNFKGWYSTPDFTGTPYDFRTPLESSRTLYAKWEQNPPNCRIDQTTYNTLSEALDAAKSGDTITLLTDILYRNTINIVDKKITFDLSDYTLDVICVQESNYTGAGLYVKNGEVRMTGNGELNVKSAVMSGHGLRTNNSVVEITNALGSRNSYGVRAENKSIVTVKGSAKGLHAVDCEGGSIVTVYGDAVGVHNDANVTCGIHTNGTDSEAIVYGDVIADDAIRLGNKGKATVYGNVYGGAGSARYGIECFNANAVIYGNIICGASAVYCSISSGGEATVTVHGNITCTYKSGIGVETRVSSGAGNVIVTVDGEINAPVFAKFYGTVVTPIEVIVPTTKEGFLTYSGQKNNATATLWLKEPGSAFHTVTGNIKSYNPLNPTTIRLMKGDELVDTVIISDESGYGQVESDFSFKNVAPGRYRMEITKDAHAKFTVLNLVVGEEDLDLTLDNRPEVQLIALRCGDINNDGLINDADLTLLWREGNYNKKTVEADNPQCDLNGDGLINDADLTILWLAYNYNRGTIVIE
ncbi:MAG: S8 family serine peptidase [Clostridiales bacterium]|nr:S8 family serine peptidase [Clostridiales bacterium]